MLHEYGHALGLEHSADANDAMGTVLQPGVRKLWSEADLAKLLAALPPDEPAPVDRPVNGLPVGSTQRTNSPSARARPRPGTDPQDTLSGNPTLERQALNAVNATLLDGNFATPGTWESTGSVSFNNGQALLTENSASQSRVAQGFVLSSQDRYLRFTVEGLLAENLSGPDDAFEVALLNANTRAALSSSTDLAGGMLS